MKERTGGEVKQMRWKMRYDGKKKQEFNTSNA
jgi:hypothetical protein